MNQSTFLQKGLSIAILVFPVFASAQQRGAAAPAVQAPMIAPSGPTVVLAPASAAHVPVHTTSMQAIHPVNHSAAPGSHRVSARNSGHGVYPKAPVGDQSGRSPGRTQASAGVTSGLTIGRTLPQDEFTDSGYAVPGLGFDYVHYAAVHPESGHHQFVGGGAVPFVGGGIYIPEGGYYVDSGSQQQPAQESEVTEEMEQATETPEAPLAEQPGVSQRARPKPSAPLPPSPEYIFVRRDGTVFFAVAYSWQNGNLQYVTQDGFRKLASLSTLDLDATSQFNEQRGLVFRSPA
jgi:hypothetical protein